VRIQVREDRTQWGSSRGVMGDNDTGPAGAGGRCHCTSHGAVEVVQYGRKGAWVGGYGPRLVGHCGLAGLGLARKERRILYFFSISFQNATKLALIEK
jgi:hypothetical protein